MGDKKEVTYNFDFYVNSSGGDVVFCNDSFLKNVKDAIDPIGYFVREKKVVELKMLYPEIPECEDMVMKADLLDYKIEGSYAVWGHITKEWLWVY